MGSSTGSEYYDSGGISTGPVPQAKKPPRSPRGSRNSHVNLKKRKIYTVGFYEDLTVYIILKNYIILKSI